jgi:hypothetical protein
MSWFTQHPFARHRKINVARAKSNRFQPAVQALEERMAPAVLVNPVFGVEPFQTDRHGEMSSPTVQLIFWGDFWNGIDSPNSLSVINAAQRVIDSGYLQGLTQYGSDGQATLGITLGNQKLQASWVAGSVTSGFGVFTINSVVNAGKLFDSGSNPTIYVVVTPPGIVDDINQPNTGFNFNNDIWVSTKLSNIADSFSLPFSHELAETMSDPVQLFGLIHSGITFGPGPQWFSGGDDQIGDHEGNRYSYREPNGALVQPFWSRDDGAWLATDGNQQRLVMDALWNFPANVQVGSLGANFTGEFDLTIDGDQFGVVGQPGSFDDSIVLDTTPAGGLSVNINGEKFQFDPNRIRNITVNTGWGNDTVDIRSMVQPSNVDPVAYTINLSDGNDTVNVMPTSENLNGVVAPLSRRAGPRLILTP